jgi:hypothetical protein
VNSVIKLKRSPKEDSPFIYVNMNKGLENLVITIDRRSLFSNGAQQKPSYTHAWEYAFGKLEPLATAYMRNIRNKNYTQGDIRALLANYSAVNWYNSLQRNLKVYTTIDLSRWRAKRTLTNLQGGYGILEKYHIRPLCEIYLKF